MLGAAAWGMLCLSTYAIGDLSMAFVWGTLLGNFEVIGYLPFRGCEFYSLSIKVGIWQMIFSVFMNDNIDITQKEAPHKDSFL